MATLLKSLWGTYYLRSGTSTPESTWDAKGQISAYLESQNIANNTSYIRIDHFLYFKAAISNSFNIESTSNYRCNYGTYQSKYLNVNMDAPVDVRISMGSTYHTVSHNSDGSCTLHVNGSNLINITVNGNGTSATRSSSFDVALPTIPRYANITGFNYDSVTMTSFHFNVYADSSIDYVQHSLNGGAWTDSGNQIISGLNPNTQYNLRCRVRRTDSGLWTESGYIYITTTANNLITSSISTVNCDSSLNVTASNPSGAQCDIKVELPDLGLNEVLRHNNTTNTTFTAEEILTLANYIPNSNSTKIRITAVTVINGVDTYFNYKDGTFSIVNANPVFNNDFYYEDTNSNTLELTGDNQKIIKGYSDLQTTISPANKAYAVKGASIVKYRLVVGEKQVDVNDNEATESLHLSLEKIDSNVFTMYAIDSRGNSAMKQISPSTYLAYFKPTLNPIAVARKQAVGTNTVLTFSGTFFNTNFGMVANDLVATYTYKQGATGELITGTTPITITKTDNNYSFSGEIAGDEGANGFDVENSYIINLTITDKLSSVSDDETLTSGRPNQASWQNGEAFFMFGDETIEGHSIQFNVDGIYMKLNDELVPIIQVVEEE